MNDFEGEMGFGVVVFDVVKKKEVAKKKNDHVSRHTFLCDKFHH